jgi:hypothetical protein
VNRKCGIGSQETALQMLAMAGKSQETALQMLAMSGKPQLYGPQLYGRANPESS